LGFVTLLGALSASGSAGATVVRALDDEALVRGSEAIVAGSVASVVALAGPVDGPAIFTRIEIDVWQTFKALPEGAPARLTLLQTGGTLGERTLHVHGQARFEVGEPVLVFIERVFDGRLIPYGMAQGKFSLIERDGRMVAVRDVSGLAVAGRAPDGTLAIRAGESELPVALDLARLERLIERLATPRLVPPPATEPSRVR